MLTAPFSVLRCSRRDEERPNYSTLCASNKEHRIQYFSKAAKSEPMIPLPFAVVVGILGDIRANIVLQAGRVRC